MIHGLFSPTTSEALRCKPVGRWFHSRWSHWNFSVP
jgi:hypothetical protein